MATIDDLTPEEIEGFVQRLTAPGFDGNVEAVVGHLPRDVRGKILERAGYVRWEGWVKQTNDGHDHIFLDGQWVTLLRERFEKEADDRSYLAYLDHRRRPLPEVTEGKTTSYYEYGQHLASHGIGMHELSRWRDRADNVGPDLHLIPEFMRGYLGDEAFREWKTEREKHDKLMQERIDAGKLIDAATCQLAWCYAQVLDPYCDGLKIPEGGDCVGCEYFVKAPDSETWVHLRDLPEMTREMVLTRMHDDPGWAETPVWTVPF
jgi:hypothetical protein